jgi:hypothetical protein
MQTPPKSYPSAGTRVRFTKISEKRPGLCDVGYWCEGHLVDDVRVGEPIWMNRYARAAQGDEKDDQRRAGLFNTSIVERVATSNDPAQSRWLIYTHNSAWGLEVLPPLPKETLKNDPLFKDMSAPGLL